ncbi:zinc-dependent metalloprotease [Ponticaulis koreensis]|uniref:zinc-dependent metalloprotease n=1 Tax=Ponticaulis koreensis TaxID=1123045 RepID=UPI000413C508|nr:zinc-dependent metalloprotease [Ponticaulis koreensis]
MHLKFIAACAAVFCSFMPAMAEAPDFSEARFEERDGFFTLQVDTEGNKIYAQLPAAGEDGVVLRMIHTAGLTGGLGSNPVGLDRGWWRDGEIMAFRRIGDRLILEIENLNYRASADNPLEARAVRESFATSFIASMEILSDEDGLVVDMTDFLTADTLGLVQYLADAGQGRFTVAGDRSLVDTANAFAFPDNIEIDAYLTLRSADPGREVSTTAANGTDVTLIQHHSFVRLPEEGYTPLEADPRTGAVTMTHYDYSASLTDPIETRYARRYRLQRDENGETINPIVFYIDPGAPEPIRSALLDGARWWSDAFATAGFPDGYRVELLPEDAHPLDIRYNVVQWVHRQTRGWSYGGGIADPRTGEMLKGHVILGSLRVRQDRMIFEGLAGTQNVGTGAPDDPVELALSRIRQLSAHEIGHSLGFAHNFAASTYDKGSVMDYPAPDIRVSGGALDFSNAYGVGVGAWDEFAATWLYGELTDDAREALVREAVANGLVFVDDGHARGIGTGHPLGNIWDNGADPLWGLEQAMGVRAIALENFGVDRVAEGRPVSDLNAVIVPIYLFHRYQTAAAGKLIGGMTFNYSVRGDGQPAAQMVPAADQRDAVDAILETITPEFLDLSDDVLNLLTPSIDAYLAAAPTRELFARSAYPAFDLTSAADTSAQMTFDVLLHPQRVARLIEFSRRDRYQMSAVELFDAIRIQVMVQPREPRLAGIAETVRARYAFALMDLVDAETSSAVEAAASAALGELKSDVSGLDTAHGDWLAEQIAAFETRPREAAPAVVDARGLPPGGPIGMDAYETCWFCE